MKFIKTEDGWYVDKNKIEWLCLGESYDNLTSAATLKIRVFAYITGIRFPLKEFVCNNSNSATQSDPRAEAQAWLEKFVADLNKEDTHVED